MASSFGLFDEFIMVAWIICIVFILIPSADADAQKSNPGQVSAERYYQAGVEAFTRGDCQKAFGYFKKSTDVDYYNDSAFFAMAQLSYLISGEKEMDRAIEYGETAVRLNPTEMHYQKLLSSLYLERFVKINDEKDAKKSSDYLNKIIETNPESVESYVMLAHLVGEQNDFDSQEKYLKKALSLDAADPEVYSALGIFYMKKSPWEYAPQAKEYFDKAMSLDPSAGHYGLSYLYFLQDKKEAAFEEFGKIADKKQREALAEIFKGRYGKIKLPEYEGAKESLAEARCKEPGLFSKLMENMRALMLLFLGLGIVIFFNRRLVF